MMWVSSKILGDAGAMKSKAFELCNWLICFVCASKELRVVVADMDDWMVNSYLP